jgi:N-acetylmuramic acid 6-phosphate etherase
MNIKVTEMASDYRNLHLMSVDEILNYINEEDRTVPDAVAKAIPQISKLIPVLKEKMEQGGRLFYIGAGTSGRLGILDASECPPTYGVPYDMVIGIIAGGDGAIRKAVEFAEDDTEQGWLDLQAHHINDKDVVVGITASGTTPYVVGAIKKANENNITTACITCNPGTELAAMVKFPIEVITGPEFVTGSTRMKAGTAQKLVLNMISTSVMIQLGRVHDNKMVDMQLSNNKLIERGTRILMKTFAWDYKRAEHILKEYGSVRAVLKAHRRL